VGDPHASQGTMRFAGGTLAVLVTQAPTDDPAPADGRAPKYTRRRPLGEDSAMTLLHKVIYGDPPWVFATYSYKGKGRSAEAHYDCMPTETIKKLPVGDLADVDCLLLLWVTFPHLLHGLDVMTSWGFTYKTIGFCWVKCRKSARSGTLLHPEADFPFGTGYYTRANAEICLLGVRGHPKVVAHDVPQLIVAPRRRHSEKPDCVYERIERLAVGPYVELFARQRRPGWDVAFSREADAGPGQRRWDSNSYPHIADRQPDT
jgi:N6-adenosine-specific RNA methylase IME4